jgi:hypothetical protein
MRVELSIIGSIFINGYAYMGGAIYLSGCNLLSLITYYSYYLKHFKVYFPEQPGTRLWRRYIPQLV